MTTGTRISRPLVLSPSLSVLADISFAFGIATVVAFHRFNNKGTVAGAMALPQAVPDRYSW